MTKEFEMLGITIDNKLKFENHVAKICRKVSKKAKSCSQKNEENASLRNKVRPIFSSYPSSLQLLQ